MSRKKVFVALSGGVDSSVAAALLKERGHNVCGIHIKMWSDPNIPCHFKEDRYDAMAVAAHLDIPFQTWDFTGEYRQAVVEYMIGEYAAGRTPNPDIMCNRYIKFGLFLRQARDMGVDFVATGHYVRKSEIQNPKSETIQKSEILNRKRVLNLKNSNLGFVSNFDIRASNFSLQIAKDGNKDQSYFLWTLTQEQLRHCLFPIGEYTKPEVRELAGKFGLPTAEKPDSQGICFIGEIDVRGFLKRYIPEHRGRVLTTAGKTVGEHGGIEFYTIGQREGIGIGGGIPYYVAEKDRATNTLVVAEGPYDEKLFKKELMAGDVNWISGKEPQFPLRCLARIRYRQPLQHCQVKRIMNQESRIMGYERIRNKSIIPNSNPMISVIFDDAQRAVTPGQSIVFYRGSEMLGGGVIQ